MPAARGTTIGHYEIQSLIGKGGMGEVYLARDRQLRRDVALKLLPADFTRSPEQLARFQREAEMLASLNHPHIATLYGLVEAGETRALAMELVDGVTLPVPVALETALDYARQIAEALEYAHERGIVHRDLKPANIKLTAEGSVKLLDFGLAKAVDDPPEDHPADAENSPTLTIGHTRAGVILGTAAYMSPEQASGTSADRRADIWSFGAVLFEMLTGQRAFRGDSVSDTLASVLKLEPDWSLLPANTPAAVRTLIARCLTKNRKQRLQAIGEARILLEKPLEVGAPEPGSARSALPWIAATALCALALPAVWFLRPQPTRPQPITFEIAPPKGANFGSQDWQFVLSPDGSQAVIIAQTNEGKQSLWLRNMRTGAMAGLPGTEFPRTPFWSPDSRYIGFFADGKLKKVPAAGGAPQVLCDARVGFASWSSQGVIVFEESGKPLQKIPENGGTPVNALEFDKARGEVIQSSPYFLPDGRRFLYGSRTGTAVRGIAFASLDGGPSKFLIQNRNSPGSYAPNPSGGPGWILYNSGNRFLAQSFDPGKIELRGEPVVLAESVQAGPNWSHTPALLSFPHLPEVSNQFTWYRRDGTRITALGSAGQVGSPAISPDGRSVVFQRLEGGNQDLWLAEGTAAPKRFTFETESDRNPLWTPDGSRILYTTNRSGKVALVERPASGIGAEQILKTFPNQDSRSPLAITQDGRWISVQFGGGGDGAVEFISRPEGKQVPFNEPRILRAEISPDARWVLYSSDASGRSEVFVRSSPREVGGGAEPAKFQLSTTGGAQPRWRADGKEIYYLAPDGGLIAVSVESGEGFFRPGSPIPLFRAGRVSSFDADPSGQRFLVTQPSGEALPNPITVIVNWTAMLPQ